jgi:hypothetical protein
MALTILTFASVSTSLVQVYKSSPILYSFPPTIQQWLLLLVVCSNTVSFLAAGTMRREPKKYYQVPPMQLGSGLRATPEEQDEGLRRWLAGEEGGVEPEANVLDYDGCGLLGLLLGTYVSALLSHLLSHQLQQPLNSLKLGITPLAQVMVATSTE